MRKVVAYSGWLGNNNIGDEALYLANQKLFDDIELSDRNYYKGSSTYLYGGGTVIPRQAAHSNVDELVAAIGVGVEDPQFRNQPFAPVDIEYHLVKNGLGFLLENVYTRHIAKRIASVSDSITADRKHLSDSRFESVDQFDYLGVRGPRSKEILSRYGIESQVVGDTALVLEPSEYNQQQTNKVAITLRSAEGVLKWSNSTEYIHTIEKFCRTHSEEYEFVFIPFRPIDISLHAELAKKIPNAEFKDYCSHINVQSAIDEISDCDMIIGERLHASILAACTFTPFLSLGYQPKNDDFVESVAMTEYHIRFDQLTDDWLADRFERIMTSDKAHQRIKTQVEDKRADIQSLAEEITTEINTRDY